MPEIINHITRFVFGLLILSATVSGVYAVNLSVNLFNSPETYASIAVACGTLALALVTYRYVQHTKGMTEAMREENRLLEKEHESKIVIDEINNVIQPAISSLKRNNKEIVNNRIRWTDTSKFTVNPVMGRPQLLFSETDFDPAAVNRFREEAPSLWTSLERHGELGQDVIDTADKLQNTLKNELIEWHKSTGVEIEPEDYDLIIDAIIRQLDSFGENHNLYDFWGANADDLIGLLDKKWEEYMDFQRAEAEYLRHSLKLEEGLRLRKQKLRREYNITNQELKN